MEAFFQEYGLLVAVATPVVVVVVMQALLFISGERGTLLLPSLKAFESIALAAEHDQPIAATLPSLPTGKAARVPVVLNEEREAA